MILKPGETVRIQCDGCMVEFELTYEPKAKELERGGGCDPKKLDLKKITCPFCNKPGKCDEV